MVKEALKRIFEFLEEKGEHKTPFLWKWKNEIPLTENDLNFKGDLDLSYLDIASLPEGLKVSGFLDLQDSNVESLPEGLEVGDWLDLRETNIKLLPKGLKVGGYLLIGGTFLTKYLDDELKDMVKPGFIKGKIDRD